MQGTSESVSEAYSLFQDMPSRIRNHRTFVAMMGQSLKTFFHLESQSFHDCANPKFHELSIQSDMGPLYGI